MHAETWRRKDRRPRNKSVGRNWGGGGDGGPGSDGRRMKDPVKDEHTSSQTQSTHFEMAKDVSG